MMPSKTKTGEAGQARHRSGAGELGKPAGRDEIERLGLTTRVKLLSSKGLTDPVPDACSRAAQGSI
jgi:hypothetical protein